MNEMHQDLRICFRRELDTFRLQMLAYSARILNNAIVNDGHFTILRCVGMSIRVCHPSMSGPTGVSNSTSAFDFFGENRFQICDLADSLVD